MEKQEVRRFTEEIDNLFGVIMRDVKVKSTAHPTMELLGGVGISLIVYYGGMQVINGSSTPGTFFSFLTALIMIYDPIKQVSKVNNSLQKGMAACARIYALLDLEPEIVDRPGAVELVGDIDEITFEQVRFSYAGEEEIIKGVDLRVRANEVLAIVGPSGSGKSTLVNLLPRFHDVSAGAIIINGRDIREYTLHSLRSKISVVTQETILFNDTIRNNILYGRPDSSEQEVEQAASHAFALDFIRKLPDGFDTVIGESGVRLSGGQRQRLSIARALLKNAPILILDEATSSLDTESEREVQKALNNLMRNRTTFVIAHRLSTIKKADRILVLEKGRIVEQGSHDDLLAAESGLYRKLYRMQI